MSPIGLVHASNGALHDVFVSSPSDDPEDFFFIQAADTQLGMMSNYDQSTKSTKKGQYSKGLITWEDEIRLCRSLVSIVNDMRPRPEFLVICGDLLDAFPKVFIRIMMKNLASIIPFP
ncbi:Metallophosphoesterase CSTP1, partial [Caligus rogercresseyi]